MPDITKCMNTACPLSDTCFRIQARDNMRQSYSMFEPEYDSEKLEYKCDYFMEVYKREET